MDREKFDQFVRQVAKHAPQEGLNFSAIEGVGTYKASNTHGRTPALDIPAIIIVVQGKKNTYVGQDRYEYSAGNLLSMFLPMPVKAEIVEANPEKPFLAAGIALDLGRLADVLLKIERVDRSLVWPESPDPSGIFSTPLSDHILDPALRLFECLADPTDAAVLSDPIIDEVYYRLLRDERGGELRMLLQQRGEIQRISRAVEHIHENLDKPVSVGDLADMVHMSRTSFFENFKAVMHMSPLQYAKSLKLHRAQTLLQEGNNASETGFLVGYNSPAQFSREFKRHFGMSPSRV